MRPSSLASPPEPGNGDPREGPLARDAHARASIDGASAAGVYFCPHPFSSFVEGCHVNTIPHCPLCGSTGPFKDTAIAIASGTIRICSNCFGYFLYPETPVEYVDSDWSKHRREAWDATVDIARRHLPHFRNRIETHLGRPIRSILEIGCSTGYLGQAFTECGIPYTGIDVDKESVDFARSRGIEAHCMTVEELPRSLLKDARYDLVVACDVLEHVSRPPEAFRSLRSVASGAIVICVPNPAGLSASLRANRVVNRLGQMMLGNRRSIVHSIDGYWHNIAYSSRSLRYFCRQAGIEVVELKDISINDRAFGFVEPNHGRLYQLVDALSGLVGRYPKLLMIGSVTE
jgi:2-polyprenyl-3-methyl-5-hydroxy-6-metoxy-1,4-benzoquinol methylase